MASVFPGSLNTYIPAAVAALQTNYSQNPALFSINRYVTVANVPNPSGYYTYHDPAEETRINYANAADFLWADGAQAQVNFAKSHQFTLFTALRYHNAFTIGDVAAQNADWNVVTDHANTSMMRLMTLRTYNILLAATTTANWGSNTDTATNLGGGYWDVSTTTLNYIKKTIQAVIQVIQKATNATVRPQDLYMVISPTVAYAIARSPEIIDYLKQSFVAKEFINQEPGSGFYYGLPDPLFGVRTIVEDRVYNSAPHGATPVVSYILGNNALFVARPGALMGPLNTMSTLTLAMYQDMNMNLVHDDFNQLTNGVLWDYYATIVRPESGYLVTVVTTP